MDVQSNFRNGNSGYKKTTTNKYLDRVPLALVFTKHFLHFFRLMLEANLQLVQIHLLSYDIFELFRDTLFFFFSFLNVEEQRHKKWKNRKMNDAPASRPQTLANQQEAPRWPLPGDSLRSASPCVIHPRDASLGPKSQKRKKK